MYNKIHSVSNSVLYLQTVFRNYVGFLFHLSINVLYIEYMEIYFMLINFEILQLIFYFEYVIK